MVICHSNTRKEIHKDTKVVTDSQAEREGRHGSAPFLLLCIAFVFPQREHFPKATSKTLEVQFCYLPRNVPLYSVSELVFDDEDKMMCKKGLR